MNDINLGQLLDIISKDFYQPIFWEYMNYHITGEYQLLHENPVYEEIQVIISSMNVIEDYLGIENTNLSKDIDNDMKE